MNKKIVLASRIFLGLIFTVFGANGLSELLLGVGFLPKAPLPPEMQGVMGAFESTKYIMPMVKITEFLTGIMFLSGQFISLASIMVFPVILNILGMHIFVLELRGMPLPLFIFACLLVNVIDRWDDFRPLLSNKN